MNPLPGVIVTWAESAEPLLSFIRYNIYRRELGDTDWNLIAFYADRSRVFHQDYETEWEVVYEYAITQISDAAGEEVESDFPDAVQSSSTWNNLFIHDRDTPSYFAELLVQGQRISGPDIEVTYLTPFNSSLPSAHVGNKLTRVFSASLTGQWDHSSGFLSKEQYNAMKALAERQIGGSVLVARHPSDIFLYCILEGLTREDKDYNFSQSLQLREVRNEADE